MNDDEYSCGCHRDGMYFCSKAHRNEARRIAAVNREYRRGCGIIVISAVCFAALIAACFI